MGARGPKKSGRKKEPLSFRVNPGLHKKILEECAYFPSKSDYIACLVQSGLENVSPGTCPACHSKEMLLAAVPGRPCLRVKRCTCGFWGTDIEINEFLSHACANK